LSRRRRRYDYDVCLSYASEQRPFVESVADELQSRSIRVFYDLYRQGDLWGKDLYVHLDEVYRKKALYCVVFVSADYARKVWTSHERRSAQARALQDKQEYILPARFDDTEIPGLPPTIGYIDLRRIEPRMLAELILAKIVESENEQLELRGLVEQPPEERSDIAHAGLTSFARYVVLDGIPGGPFWNVSFDPTGRVAAFGCEDGLVRFVDVNTGTLLSTRLEGHRNTVLTVAFSPDGQTVATGGHDQSVRLWHAAAGTQIGPPLVGHTGPVLRVRFSPDGKTVASVGLDATTWLWPVAPGKRGGRALVPPPTEDPLARYKYDAAFAPDGQTLAVCGANGEIQQWSVAAGSQTQFPLAGHEGSVFCVAYSSSGLLASGGNDHTVRLWDKTGGRVVGRHEAAVYAVAFTGDGLLISADLSGTVQLRNTHGEEASPRLDGHGRINDMAISPGGLHLVVVGRQLTIWRRQRRDQ